MQLSPCSPVAAGRDSPPKSRPQDAPGAPALTSSVNSFHASWRKAPTLPQLSLDFPDTSSPKEVIPDRGEESRRPSLPPLQPGAQKAAADTALAYFLLCFPAATPTIGEKSPSDLWEAGLPHKILQVSSSCQVRDLRLPGKLRAWPSHGCSCLMSSLAHAWC